MNFEAVGPERLVLVARDPWIAHHVSDEILSPRSIEKDHPPDDLAHLDSPTLRPKTAACADLGHLNLARSRSMNVMAITSPPRSEQRSQQAPRTGYNQLRCPDRKSCPYLPRRTAIFGLSAFTGRPRDELAENLGAGISASAKGSAHETLSIRNRREPRRSKFGIG